ncbi:cytochrome p450 domain-containing protein [Phthorimaea operculella]|nr:cytochrome p450 domain-containing protein [Phthorimaea operculella]
MEPSRLPRRVLLGAIANAKRGVGRPMLRFKDCAKRDMAAFDIDHQSWEKLAENRDVWRKRVYDGRKAHDDAWFAVFVNNNCNYFFSRMLLLLIWGVAALTALVLYFKNAFSKFEKRGVKAPPAVFPFGNWRDMFLGTKHASDIIVSLYNRFPTERFIGTYEFTNPKVVIRDMELIKKITIKDFDYFVDHQTYLDPDINPLFGKGVFFMRGQTWKDMRSTLSPAFTGSKMRQMIPFMEEVGDQMILNLKKNISASKSGQVEVDAKDLMARYACDVIASCAFGLKVDSHSERENEFYLKGTHAATFKFKQQLVMLISSITPWAVRWFNLKLFDKPSENFFRNIVLSTMEERERLNIHRPDMIHLLMEARKGKLQQEEKTHDTDAGFATVEEFSAGKNITRGQCTNLLKN